MGIEFLITSIALIIIAGLAYVSWHLGRSVGFSEARALFEVDPQTQSSVVEFSPIDTKIKPRVTPNQTRIQSTQTEKSWLPDSARTSPMRKSR